MMAAAVSEDKVGEIDGLLWLGSLHQISGIVLGERGLRRALYELCETLGSRHGVKRGRALALRDGLVHIDVAYGVEEPSGAVPLRTAKRMMDRAIDEARPIAMTGSEERPFGRANADSGRVRGDMTFICVPIRLDSEIVGALGIDACFETEAEYLAGCWSMEIVAAMVAHKIKIAWGVAGAKLPAGDSGALGAQRIRGHIDEPTVIRNSAV